MEFNYEKISTTNAIFSNLNSDRNNADKINICNLFSVKNMSDGMIVGPRLAFASYNDGILCGKF
jgi:hypothetical protein